MCSIWKQVSLGKICYTSFVNVFTYTKSDSLHKKHKNNTEARVICFTI